MFLLILVCKTRLVTWEAFLGGGGRGVGGREGVVVVSVKGFGDGGSGGGWGGGRPLWW